MTTPKQIIFEEQARELLISGIEKITDLVGFTLGPRGRNVGLEESYGMPKITNDGNSIVNDVTLKNPFENMGVSIAKEVVQKVQEQCGDGTTTATLLLGALSKEGIKQIASGASSITLKRGMEKALDAVLKSIDALSTPVKSSEEICSIATVSASGNSEVGNLIAKAIEQAEKPELVMIEEGKTMETTIELIEGFQFDRGYLSPYFCTDAQKMTVEMEDPKILIVDKKIATIQDLLPVLQNAAASGKPLFIIAEDIEGEVLSTLVINKLRGILNVCAVKAPGFGDRRKNNLEDIAALTGAIVVCEEAGIRLNDLPEDAYGKCEKIKITKDSTLIVGGVGSQEKIDERLNQINFELKDAANKYDKEKLQERIGKLKGKVATIHIGAATEPELKQKKQLFEDSLSSTRAALEEGIVPGGGIALIRARQAIKELSLDKEETRGANILFKACEAPLIQIANNAGFDGAVILAKVENGDSNTGFNVLTEKYEDLLSSGVIDPAKVVKTALRHAASAAGIVWISEVLISDWEEDTQES
ncbi:MAG: chaperonin GroEL [Waddliaceae bacterium]